MKSIKRGVILFAHGSKDLSWKEPFIAIERKLTKSLPEVAIRAAYLENSAPNLHDVVAHMADNGVAAITVVPLFLAIGAHSRKDFPKIEAELVAAHPEISFIWTDVLGQWEETQNALAAILAERLSAGHTG